MIHPSDRKDITGGVSLEGLPDKSPQAKGLRYRVLERHDVKVGVIWVRKLPVGTSLVPYIHWYAIGLLLARI